MRCPACSRTMRPIERAEIPAHRCDGCRGLWIDLTAAEHRMTRSALAGVAARFAGEGEAHEASCPVCSSQRFVRHADGELWLDRCAGCGGLYLAEDQARLLVRRRPDLPDEWSELAEVALSAAAYTGLGAVGISPRAVATLTEPRSRSAWWWLRMAAAVVVLGFSLYLAFEPGRPLHTWILGPDLRIEQATISETTYFDSPPARPKAEVRVENPTDTDRHDCSVVWRATEATSPTTESELFDLPARATERVETTGPTFWRSDSFASWLTVECDGTRSPRRYERLQIVVSGRPTWERAPVERSGVAVAP